MSEKLKALGEAAKTIILWILAPIGLIIIGSFYLASKLRLAADDRNSKAAKEAVEDQRKVTNDKQAIADQDVATFHDKLKQYDPGENN